MILSRTAAHNRGLLRLSPPLSVARANQHSHSNLHYYQRYSTASAAAATVEEAACKQQPVVFQQSTPNRMSPAAEQQEGIKGEELRVQLAQDKSHHAENGRFRNPWRSFQMPSFLTLLQYVIFTNNMSVPKKSVAEGKVPKVQPLDRTLIDSPPAQGELQLTWLGHASLLLQIDGASVLFDPVFSDRCSPFQWLGPKRYTEAPCTVDELPAQIDFLVLSHNHYDHLDWNTLKQVARRYPDIRVFAPLGNRPILESIGFKTISIGDWWQEFKVPAPQGEFTFACTPAQHMTARGLFDRGVTLWSSWVVKGPSGGKFFFSGDTGYSAVSEKNPDGEHCPAFEQIGKVYGPIDLSAIAIGAYDPPRMFSGVHVGPEQAVRIHDHIASRKSVAIHWGTFILTDEPVDEPPKRLLAELSSTGHHASEFVPVSIGETVRQKADSSSE
ncbi:Metallo-hydrolase/oxidoreductase [Martensiomyces pterosporus]|nr:Metallo-hydrolase/oxidoreductase [Martensiomyces pterosporus]